MTTAENQQVPRAIKSWHRSFMNLAFQFANDRSKDPSTQVGCVIVDPPPAWAIKSMGYNGLPRGIEDKERLERYQRPTKYAFFEHGERNAIYNAARFGVSLNGCYAYITHHPCCDCARALIQAGIKKIILPKEECDHSNTPERWVENFRIARDMLGEVDIKVISLSEK